VTVNPADAFFAQAAQAAEKKEDEAPAAIKRDRWQRPLITPPGGGKPEPYIRVSTLAGALDDKTALGDWKARMTGLGVARSADLTTAFGSIQDIDDPEQKKTANELAEQAQERAKSSAKRIMGTGFHTITETHDKGRTPEFIPDALRDLYDDYARLTHGVAWRAIEQFVVVDEVKAAGTTDRVGHRPGDAKPRVWDVKTGRVDYGQLKFAVQLACYARGMFYNPATGERRPWPDIDLRVGYILHADPNTGKVTPYEVDLEAGWAAAKTAREVYGLRKAKVMTEASFAPPAPPRTQGVADSSVIESALTRPLSPHQGAILRESYNDRQGPPKTVNQRLAACTSLDQLTAIYNETGGSWGAKERNFADYMAGYIQSQVG